MTQNGNKKSWGGPWTEEKLEAFEAYVKAYLTIMNPRRDKNHWTLIYFDGFAGNGTRTDAEEAKTSGGCGIHGATELRNHGKRVAQDLRI